MNDLNYYINTLVTNKTVIQQLLSIAEPEQVYYRPGPEKWNLLEIICHLHDEERDDFRTRLKSVLENPEQPFPPIDPSGWVQLRDYASRNFNDMAVLWSHERDESVKWLKTIQHASWNNTYQHSKIGPMSAKFILANWLAHDYLHIRQITKLKYDYLKMKSEQELHYAGNW